MGAPFRVEPYWLVHGTGPASHKHGSKADAVREAERLARANPGQAFVVLEAVEAVRKLDVERVAIGAERTLPLFVEPKPRGRGDYAHDDDIPF